MEVGWYFVSARIGWIFEWNENRLKTKCNGRSPFSIRAIWAGFDVQKCKTRELGKKSQGTKKKEEKFTWMYKRRRNYKDNTHTDKQECIAVRDMRYSLSLWTEFAFDLAVFFSFLCTAFQLQLLPQFKRKFSSQSLSCLLNFISWWCLDRIQDENKKARSSFLFLTWLSLVNVYTH